MNNTCVAQEVANEKQSSEDILYSVFTQGGKHYFINQKGEIAHTHYHFPEYKKPSFSDKWLCQGFCELIGGKHLGPLISLEQMLNVKETTFKNGKAKYVLVDLDHGTTRIWGDRIMAVYPSAIISFPSN